MTLAKLDSKINALIEFETSIVETMVNELQTNDHIIIDMNAYTQLFELGINTKGVHLDSIAPYTSKTISIKLSKGQPTDRITLRDTGDFHSSFRVVFDDTKFTIVATDSKSEDLMGKYGEDILGLTDENKNELITVYILSSILALRDRLL